MDDNKLKVFISYSRKDVAFAEKLVEVLEQRGIQCKFDTRDLPTLEDWRRELLGLIHDADAVIFIVSSHSIASEVCEWEVEQVRQLNKRLAPIIIESVDADRVPKTLSSINFLYFDGRADFETQCDKLAGALQIDLPWIKEHTRLSDLARRWEARGRQRSLLLRGNDLDEAERWQANRPQGAPALTDAHRVYIAESRLAWRRRQRFLVAASLAAAVVAVGLAGAAIWQRQIAVGNQAIADQQRGNAEQSEADAVRQRGLAEQQRAVAETNAKEAEQQRGVAESNEKRATQERNRTLLSQSRYLTDLAKRELAAERTTRAMLLAMEALPDDAGANSNRPWYPPAEQALLDALSAHHERSLLLQNRGFVTEVQYFDQGKRFWSLSASAFVVWDAATDQPVYSIASGGNTAGSDDDFVSFAPMADGKSGILARHKGVLSFIDLASGKVNRTVQIVRLSMNRDVGQIDGKVYLATRIGTALVGSFANVILPSPGGKYLAALSEPDYDKNQYLNDLYVYRLDDMSIVYRAAGLLGVDFPTGMSFSPDEKFFFAAGDRRSLLVDLSRGTVSSTLKQELLDSTEDRRFSFLKTTAPIVYGFDGSADDPVRITGTSVQPPNTVIFSRFLAPRRLLMVLRGGEVAIWNTDQATRSTVWKAQGGWFISAALSDDLNTLAIGTAAGKIILFDTRELKPTGELTGHQSDVYSVKFGAKNQTLLSTSRETTAKLWNLQDRSLIMTMTGSRTDASTAGAVTSAAIWGSTQIVTGHLGGALRSWSTAARVTPRYEDGPFGRWSAVNYSNDGRWLLATAGNDLLIYDQKSPGRVRRLTGHTELIISLVTDTTSKLAATTSLDGTVRLWNIETGVVLYNFGTPMSPIRKEKDEKDYTPLYTATRWQFARAIAFSPDGRYLFIGRNSGIGEVRDCASGAVISAFDPGGEPPGPDSFNPKKGIVSATFTSDSRYVIAGRLNGSLVTQSLGDGTFRAFVLENGKSPVGEITAIVPSANATGLSIAAASKPYGFNGVAGAVALGLKYGSGARQAGFEFSGNLLWLNLTKLLEGDIEAFPYEATTLTLRPETRAEAGAASGLNIDKEGVLNITGAEAVNAIEIQKVDAGRANAVDALGADLSQFSKHFGTISGMRIVDEVTLLTWSHDFTVRLWNIFDRSHRAALVGAKDEIVRVVASAHGGRIAAAAGNKVLVWDPRNPDPLAIYQAPGEVADIVYSPDGRKLAAATASGQLVVWDQFEATQAVVDFAKSVVNRCLTRIERREFALEETGPQWCVAQRKYPFRAARMGIQLTDADGGGAKIVEVIKLPALAAGLRKNDIIYQVGTQPTRNSEQATQAIQQSEIGKGLDILIRRDGKQQRIVAYPGPED